MKYKKATDLENRIRVRDRFGIRSAKQVVSDYGHVLKNTGEGFH
jgi:hypothetical protein